MLLRTSMPVKILLSIAIWCTVWTNPGVQDVNTQSFSKPDLGAVGLRLYVRAIFVEDYSVFVLNNGTYRAECLPDVAHSELH